VFFFLAYPGHLAVTVTVRLQKPFATSPGNSFQVRLEFFFLLLLAYPGHLAVTVRLQKSFATSPGNSSFLEPGKKPTANTLAGMPLYSYKNYIKLYPTKLIILHRSVIHIAYIGKLKSEIKL